MHEILKNMSSKEGVARLTIGMGALAGFGLLINSLINKPPSFEPNACRVADLTIPIDYRVIPGNTDTDPITFFCLGPDDNTPPDLIGKCANGFRVIRQITVTDASGIVGALPVNIPEPC